NRWLLVGPKRSGSIVHIDPMGTSAWNTLLSGRKLWVLSPPGTLNVLEGNRKPGDSGISESDKELESEVEAINYFIDVLPRVL
ncbi:unnamed protein product, partial [Sphacelaria rigidula]